MLKFAMKPPSFRVFLLEEMKHLLQDGVWQAPATQDGRAACNSGKSLPRICVTPPWQDRCSPLHAPQSPVLGTHVAVGGSQTIAAPGLWAQSQDTVPLPDSPFLARQGGHCYGKSCSEEEPLQLWVAGALFPSEHQSLIFFILNRQVTMAETW